MLSASSALNWNLAHTTQAILKTIEKFFVENKLKTKICQTIEQKVGTYPNPDDR